MFLKSTVHISKGKFIGNPNEKEISRVALLSPACINILSTKQNNNQTNITNYFYKQFYGQFYVNIDDSEKGARLDNSF